MLEDFRLRVFVTVAGQKSFSKAAQLLKISQPAVSQHISELEKQSGVKLFHRQYGVTLLTPAGEVFKKFADKIIEDYSCVEAMFSKFPDSIVRISAPEDVYDHIVKNLLADFLNVHPEVVMAHTFPDSADLNVTIMPINNEKGMLALSFHPSKTFASTRLWSVLSKILQPTLK